eukprot:COSAG04_NODE_28446_length_275_cov_1.176136_2_plen_41_part_01
MVCVLGVGAAGQAREIETKIRLSLFRTKKIHNRASCLSSHR